MQLRMVVRDLYGKEIRTEIMGYYLYHEEAVYAANHLNAQPQTFIGQNRSYEVHEDGVPDHKVWSSWRPLERGQRWVNPITGLGATIELADNSEPNGRVLATTDGGDTINYPNGGFRVHYCKLAQQRKPYVNEIWRKNDDHLFNARVLRNFTNSLEGDYVEFVQEGPLKESYPREVATLRRFHEEYSLRDLKWDRSSTPIPDPTREPHGSIAGTAVVVEPEPEPEQLFWVEVHHIRYDDTHEHFVLRRDQTLEQARALLNDACNDYVAQGWTLGKWALLDSSSRMNPDTWVGYRYTRRSTICPLPCCAQKFDTVEITIEVPE